MFVRAQCSNPDCGRAYKLSANLVGKSVRCKQCRQTFTVSASQETLGGDSATNSDTAEVVPKNGSSERLARFEIHERLGGGAYGVVYRAFDPQLDREVALKVPRAGTLEKAGAVQRFMREAKAAAQLRHPNIVPIYDAGRIGDQYYIASAFIAGESLDNVVEAGPLKPRRAARIVQELAEAFDYAHTRGIIHRDIKPANVMLDEEDHPHVMDFGLARFDSLTAKLTQDGTVMGTPAYMSPEQASGQNERVNAASDQYSLGVLFYELLCGQTPFSGPPAVVIVNILKNPAPSPRGINPKIPRDLETICLKAMAKEPARRYASCHEFAEDLQRWKEGGAISARRVSLGERLLLLCRRNPSMTGLIATAALLLFVVAIISSSAKEQIQDLAERERKEIERANVEKAKADEERAKSLKLTAENAALKTADLKPNGSPPPQPKPQPQPQPKLVTESELRALYATQIRQAQTALEESRLAEAIDLLDLWDPTKPLATAAPNNVIAADGKTAVKDPRDFEWYYLNRKAHSELLTLDGDTTVAFSPDGTRLAAPHRGLVKVWDIPGGILLWTSQGAPKQITVLEFSPDGKQLACGGFDLMLLDATTGHEIRTWDGHNKTRISSVAYRPDGKRLASAASDGTVKVWDVASGKETLAFREPPPTGLPINSHIPVLKVAFSPDGKHLATISSNRIKITDASSGQEILPYKGHPRPVENFIFSSDGKQITSFGAGTIESWDLVTQAVSNSSTINPEFTQGVIGSDLQNGAFDSSGLRLAHVNRHTVRILDLGGKTGDPQVFHHRGIVTGVQFSPDGNLLITATADSLQVWDARSDQQMFVRGTDYPGKVFFNPDATRIAGVVQGVLGGPNLPGQITIWDTASGNLLLNKSQKAAQSAAFSPDGKRVASSGLTQANKAEIKIWDSTNGNELLTLPAPDGVSVFPGVAFSPIGNRIASVAGAWDVPQNISIWDASTGSAVLSIPGQMPRMRKVVFSSDGAQIIAMNNDGLVKAWDAPTGLESRVISKQYAQLAPRVVAVSSDGRHVATSDESAVDLWDAVQERDGAKLTGHSLPVTQMAFTSNGSRIASSSSDGNAKLWDTANGKELITFKGFVSEFSQDGTRLATNIKGAITILDARPWTPELKAEQQARNLVRFLFNKGLAKDAVKQALAETKTITELVRQLANQFADGYVAKPEV